MRAHFLPPHHRRRLTIVTDSIAKGSLFGGVGTAMIFGTLLANRLDADLRIITRLEPPVPDNLDHVLGIYGIKLKRESQFRFAYCMDRQQVLDVQAGELFLTTSWWTTEATLACVPPASIVYLLQEDERLFYPHGDERLRCDHLLNRTDLRFVINSALLLEHLVADGFTHMQANATSFEPAFPATVYRPRPKAAGAKHRFLFYARPANPRNLFYLGIEVIDAALTRGIINAHDWEIVLVGKDIPAITFGSGVEPVRLQNLNWSDYADLVGGTDLGLSLMYTPHPSYPPLDLAASGAVVVTNRCGIKQDLSKYSSNILCCDPTLDALLEGLAQGVALAMDTDQRERNHAAAGLSRDWSQSLQPVLDQLCQAH